MGEEETKPKVEHKPEKGHHAQRHYHAKPKFKAPTPGLEDVVFTTGLTKDAVDFEENKMKWAGTWPSPSNRGEPLCKGPSRR